MAEEKYQTPDKLCNVAPFTQRADAIRDSELVRGATRAAHVLSSPDQNTLNVITQLKQSSDGSDHPGLVFHWVVATHIADDDPAVRNTCNGPQPRPRLRIGAEFVGVDRIWDDNRSIGSKAYRLVLCC
ncbi:hypothetical protein K3752_19175 (plasmid) [Ruegeria sp. B32]|nr:hypothetical protein [Ruegeria sp. B32]UWR09521.1 hypothetical protein K3752_19175 [Ruegeria sp. B32]